MGFEAVEEEPQEKKEDEEEQEEKDEEEQGEERKEQEKEIERDDHVATRCRVLLTCAVCEYKSLCRLL